MFVSRMGWGLVLLLLRVCAPEPLLGQEVGAPEGETIGFGSGVSRFGFTYVDLDSGHPTPAVEVSYFEATPRIWVASPVAGALASARGAFYAYVGLELPIGLPFGITARPSLSTGFYEKGGGVDLGHPVEFRSALLLERPLSNRIRMSFVVFHLSNAALGVRNPGLEAAGLGFSVVPGAGVLERVR